MFEFFYKKGSVRQTSRILWETWLCENFDAWKRLSSLKTTSIRWESPLRFMQTLSAWKNNSKLSTKFRILIYRTISKARTLRFLLLYCLRREKNWNRFWFQNNLRMKTWLKYFVKVFGTNTVPYYYGSPARPLNYNIVSKTFRYEQNM